MTTRGFERMLGWMKETAESGSVRIARDSDEGPTDEVSGVEDTFLGHALVVGGAGGASKGEDFEHQRAVASARMRLFGSAPEIKIGRYTIEGRLGAGGMGEVYLGHDPELERDVAIKRVLPERGGEREQIRLKREAKALARLSHPNVVQVYDSGEHQGRMFLAMEYVAGSTLKDWLEGELPRGWREVIARFLAAGRGLAAAHEAGVVHRDFKPENVLIGEDGQVRVADFGLAFAPSQARRASEGGLRAPEGGLAQTMVSSVAGTIRFMPLEQLRGETVDERSDQFAFCVALYEALWEQPPFELNTVHDRLDALEAGALRAPELGGVPQVLWRVIRRGLCVPRDERWPDMHRLLAALERGVHWRRRVALGIGVGAGALGLGLAALFMMAKPACEEQAIGAQLAGVWDREVRDEIAARVGGLEVEHGEQSLERIVAGIDGWAEGWIDARTRLCEDQAAGAISPQLARLQGQCLALQQRQIGGLVDALRSESLVSTELGGAVRAVTELPTASSCDEYALSLIEPPPAAIEDEVARAREQLFLGHQLRLLGRLEQGRGLVEQARASAEALRYGPLEAEGLAEVAKAEIDGGSIERGMALLLDSIDLAEASRHDKLAAELWTVASIRAAGSLDDPEQAGLWLRRAEVGWQRVEPDARYEAMLHYARGNWASAAGHLDEAQVAYAAALARLDGADGPERCDYESALAWVNEQRDPSGADVIPGYERALRTAERVWGEHHFSVGDHVNNLGLALERAGERERAHALFERAAKLWTSSHARPHRSWLDASQSLAKLALERGELDLAEAHAHRLAQLEALVLPEGHPDRAASDIFLARVYALREDRAPALEFSERALAKLVGSVEATDARVLELRGEQATHLLALERFDEAERSYEALIAGVESQAPAAAIPAFLGLTELELRRDRPQAAAAHLARLDALGLSEDEIGPYELAQALLRALVVLRQGDSAAPELARLAAAQTRTPYTGAQLEAWFEDLALTPAERETLGYAG